VALTRAASATRQRAMRGFKASLVFLPTLGVAWLFGFLIIEQASTPMAYIFTVFNSLQGLVLFLFHVVLDPEARKAWRSFLCPDRNKFFDSTDLSSRLARSAKPMPVTARKVSVQPLASPSTLFDETDFGAPSGFGARGSAAAAAAAVADPNAVDSVLPRRSTHFYPRGFSETDVMLYRELSTPLNLRSEARLGGAAAAVAARPRSPSRFSMFDETDLSVVDPNGPAQFCALHFVCLLCLRACSDVMSLVICLSAYIHSQ
jgi:hypothetical protein